MYFDKTKYLITKSVIDWYFFEEYSSDKYQLSDLRLGRCVLRSVD